VRDREQVRAAFENPREFTTSPLYRCLSRTVAATGELLDLACLGLPGQYPTFLRPSPSWTGTSPGSRCAPRA